MAGRTGNRMALQMMGVAIAFALAAVPAMAGSGGGGSSGGSASGPKVTMAVDTTHVLGSLSLPGCGLSESATLQGCRTTARIAAGAASSGVCAIDRVFVSGTAPVSGACSLGAGAFRAGLAPVSVSSHGCDVMRVETPETSGDATVTLLDPSEIAWRLQSLHLESADYTHAAAGDVWNLETGSGVTTRGSWAVFTSGRRTLTMWLEGSLVSTGWCSAGVDAVSFVINVTSIGFVTQ